MREVILNKTMTFVQNDKYSKEDLEKIHYGLECLYIFITKGIIIFTVAYFLGILKYTLFFVITYGLVRTFACGLHATSSLACLIASTLLFLLFPFLSKVLIINNYIRLIVMLISTLLIYKFAPADTKKRPIINEKKRKKLKYISTFISLSYMILTLFIKKNFILNSLMIGLTLEAIMILPITYKIFKLPYYNYIDYLKSHS